MLVRECEKHKHFLCLHPNPVKEETGDESCHDCGVKGINVNGQLFDSIVELPDGSQMLFEAYLRRCREERERHRIMFLAPGNGLIH